MYFGSISGGDDHLHVTYESPIATQLTIADLRETDGGSYACYIGPVRATFRLIIQGRGVIMVVYTNSIESLLKH